MSFLVFAQLVEAVRGHRDLGFCQRVAEVLADSGTKLDLFPFKSP